MGYSYPKNENQAGIYSTQNLTFVSILNLPIENVSLLFSELKYFYPHLVSNTWIVEFSCLMVSRQTFYTPERLSYLTYRNLTHE